MSLLDSLPIYGDQGPVQEVSDADHAQAAISVPDDQSDPDGERPLRLLGDWRLDHAARCRACLSRRRRRYGLSGLAKAQLLRSEEHTSELQSLMRISYAVF